MTEYLSKEEIKQWRSSLEKITLEEFASRLGKSIEPPKSTHDIADIVLKGKPVSDMDRSYSLRAEKLSTIAQRAMEREQEISVTPFSMKNITQEIEDSSDILASKIKLDKKEVKNSKTSQKSNDLSSKKSDKKSAKQVSSKSSAAEKTEMPKTLREEVRYVFKKVLTDREQRVFDYFLSHKGEIVYAKDLATLLDLPKDYVYKYIKNIRTKVDGAELQNAEQGGFLLKK